MIGQITDYLSQARNESMVNQYLSARYLSITRKDNYILIRINCGIPKQLATLDGVKYISEYEKLGNVLKNLVPLNLFK